MSQTFNQPKLYAGVLAKIGAERGKLLSENKFKTLAETKDLSGFTSQLRDTSYQAQIAKVPLPLTGRKLERAFNENLIESTEKIITNSPRHAKNFLNLHILWLELENIKVLIKAANVDLNPEQRLAKVYFSVEDYLKNRVVFEDAAKASGVKQVVNAFKNTAYRTNLNLGLAGYEETGSTARIDIFLDKMFYEKLQDSYHRLKKSEKPHALLYASIQNDSFTLLTLLRGKALNHEANWLRLTVPKNNFNISKETVEALLCAPDFESALKIAIESHYGKYFLKSAIPEESLGFAEKAFKKARFEYAKSSRISENFNIGAPLAFLTQKEAEVHNLIALSTGVDAAVNPERILVNYFSKLFLSFLSVKN